MKIHEYQAKELMAEAGVPGPRGRASESADLILTTGGVSVGEADYLVDVFGQMGQVDFWSVAIKPGRPTLFGTLGDALYLGLPGNPVSVLATFYQLARPAILALSALWGAFAFPLYSLAVAHSNDHAAPEEFVEVSGGLLLIYAAGAVVGPGAATVAMAGLGPAGLYVFTAMVHVLFGIYAIWRLRQHAPAPPDEKVSFFEALEAAVGADGHHACRRQPLIGRSIIRVVAALPIRIGGDRRSLCFAYTNAPRRMTPADADGYNAADALGVARRPLQRLHAPE